MNKSDYYKAYDKRYGQVYEKNMLWSSKDRTPEVIESIISNNISQNDKILELGCGEGRDALYLLDNGYNVLAVDYSITVIDKCRKLSNNKYYSNFRQFDIMEDKIDVKFKFIYSIAVLHMFVLESHRNKFLSFIREHLEDDGKCLICILGDGVNEYTSNIDEAFNDVDRKILNSDIDIKVAATSCRIVNWKNLEKELIKNSLKVEKKWISRKVPEFNPAMCVIVSK